MEQRIHTCPDCGDQTSRIHDCRTQIVKDISSFWRFTVLYLKKRRHVCPLCGKKFYEQVDFLPKYHRITNRMFLYMLQQFRESWSMKSVARSNNVSSPTTARVLNYTPLKLPKVLSIDEFRGNSGSGKLQCILTDLAQRKIFDILPSRSSQYLYAYFSKFANHKDVEFLVMDMYSPYKQLAKALSPNAKIIADRYHYVRLVDWAIERVRKKSKISFMKIVENTF